MRTAAAGAGRRPGSRRGWAWANPGQLQMASRPGDERLLANKGPGSERNCELLGARKGP